MVYRKGELSPAAIDRDWPHQVAVRISDGAGLGHVDAAGALSSLCERGHEVTDETHRYRVFCFSDAEQATAFKAWSGGVEFDPRDRGRGSKWMHWYRGRGAEQDLRRAKRR